MAAGEERVDQYISQSIYREGEKKSGERGMERRGEKRRVEREE